MPALTDSWLEGAFVREVDVDGVPSSSPAP